jgi:hypothetical protein
VHGFNVDWLDIHRFHVDGFGNDDSVARYGTPAVVLARRGWRRVRKVDDNPPSHIHVGQKIYSGIDVHMDAGSYM